MTRKRTFVIGDIHGMRLEFEELVEKCGYRQDVDRLILVGDLCDRGPDSAGCVRYAKEIGAELAIGNHDDKYLRYRRHEQKKTHTGRKNYKNPMRLPPEKQEVWDSLTDDDLDYIESGKYCVPVWEYNALVVHAGVLPGPYPDRREREEYIFTRYVHKDTHRLLALGPNFSQPPDSIYWTEIYDGTATIVYGHHVRSMTEPIIETNDKGGRTIGIDTGAPFGGMLTCVVFNTDGSEEYFHVQSKKTWRQHQVGTKDKNGR